MDSPKQALVGIFDAPDTILEAAEAARKRGWKQLDALLPYPLHGIDHALGLKPSWVPWVTLIMGIGGAFAGFAFEAWTSAVDWPLIVGGKPFISWPAYVPIMFECGILIGGVSTFVAMLVAARLPNSKRIILHERLTDDQFGLVVPLIEGVHEGDVADFLKVAGAHEVRRVEA